MSDVYSQATRVLVWLGGATETLQSLLPSLGTARAIIAVGHEQAQSGQAKDGEGSSRDIHDELLRYDWQPLYDLLVKPWFTRKWVVQEVSLAKQVIMYCADVSFPFETLGEIVQLLTTWSVSVPLLASLPLDFATGLSNTDFLFRSYFNKMDPAEKAEDNLIHLAIKTRRFHCSDPRDHIYSLLSLRLEETPTKLAPDYLSDAASAYSRFTIWNLIELGRPEILSIATDHDPLIPLPSWTPNFGTMENMNQLSNYGLDNFSAGGKYTPGCFTVSEDSKVLKCRGKMVDTVKKSLYRLADKELSGRIPWHLANDSSTRRGLLIDMRTFNWIRDCKSLAAEDPGMADEDGTLTPARYEQFWRTILCDTDLGSDAGQMRPSWETPSITTWRSSLMLSTPWPIFRWTGLLSGC